MQVSFTAHTPSSDTVEPFTRTNPETIQAYEEGKQLDHQEGARA